MRITEDERDLLRATFKGNDKLLKLLRKLFLPELDPDAPIGQNIDLWMTVPVKEMDPMQAQVNILARNSLIMHLEQQLVQISILANQKAETPEEKLEKDRMNSSK